MLRVPNSVGKEARKHVALSTAVPVAPISGLELVLEPTGWRWLAGTVAASAGEMFVLGPLSRALSPASRPVRGLGDNPRERDAARNMSPALAATVPASHCQP